MKRITLLITIIILLLQSFVVSAQVTIGSEEITGKKIPINPYYGYTYSQVIYLQSEIGAAMDIGHLIYNATPETTLEDSSLWDVYIGHTTKTQFDTTSDWVALADLTEVFTGTVTIDAGVVHILLDSEFSYNGTDNLVIAVDENLAGYDAFSHSFYASTVTNPRSLSFWNDTTNPNPNSPPTAMLHQNFIANITLAPTPTCAWPTDLTASGMTGTTAELGWYENGTATAWQIEYGPAGFTPGDGTVISAPTNPFTITDLNSGTDYQFYVQADCGGGDLSTFTGPFNFQTIITCPTPTDLAAASITVDSAELSWVEAGTATTWNLEYGPTGFIPGEGTLVTDVAMPYSLSGLSSETTYDFYVQSECSATDSSTFTGPFSFTTLISCPAPTDFTATDMTGDSVILTWVEAASATTWNIEYGPVGFTPGDGTVVTGVTNPYTLSGLESSTVYDVYVYAECAVDDISSGTQTSFMTSILPGTCGLYSIEMTDSYGDGWNGGYVDVYINGTLFYDGLTLASGTGPEVTDIPVDEGDILSFLYTGGSWSYENQYRIYNQLGNLVAEEGVDPSIPENIGDPTIPNGLEACPSCPAPTGLTTNLVLAYTAELAWEINGVETEWNIEYGPTGFTLGDGTSIVADSNPFTISGLTPETTYDYYVQAACAVDDLSSWADPFTFTTPVTCPAPTELTATDSTETTVTLGWMENGVATEWQIEYGTVGFTPGAGTTLTADSNPFTLSDLTDSTSYDYYVQAVCDVDDSSVWVGPFTFATSLVPGTCGIYTLELEDTYGDGWNGGFVDLYVNGVILHAGVTLTSGTGPESTDFSVDINDIISVDYTSGSFASENIYRLYDESGTLIIEMATVGYTGPEDLGNPAVPSGIQACPSCPAPIDLTATPSVFDAEVAWTETGATTTWNIEYGLTGFTPGEGTIITGVTNPYTITGLSSSMNYDYYVQADCGDDDMSMWSGPISFTTLLVNDECMNALDLPLDGSILNTSNLNASASGETPIPVDICGDIAGAQDVWYSVTATELSDITIATSAFEGSSFEDTILVVYSGECGSLEMIGCNDDFESAYSSITVFGVEEDVTLYVRVFSWGSLVYDAFGISASSVPSLGVNEGFISNFSMYPNPVDNTLNLKASVSLDSIVIYDMLGRVIISSTPFTMEATIDTSTLESGAYIVKVQSKNNVDSYNLMKR